MPAGPGALSTGGVLQSGETSFRSLHLWLDGRISVLPEIYERDVIARGALVVAATS
jgi:hypothetical protein